MRVEDFIAKWQNTYATEKAVSQSHFKDVCRLVGFAEPYDPGISADDFAFEYTVKKIDGSTGFVDAFLRGRFGMEYKQRDKYKTLGQAYVQLNDYREGLNNPPLLVVCDIAHWEIHTQFEGQKKVYAFTHEDIRRPEIYRTLHDLFHAPNRLHPNQHSEAITNTAAAKFRDVAEYLEKRKQAETARIANFITQLVFSMFAEDVRLLPPGFGDEKGILTDILASGRPMQAVSAIRALFEAMRHGGTYHTAKIEYFNGSLFNEIDVFDVDADILRQLADVSRLDWSTVEPSIFGTLFERVLDKAKRRKLGAHYTSAADIKAIVDPVLMRPLRRAWEAAQTEAAPIRAQYDDAATDHQRQRLGNKLDRIRKAVLKQVREIRVLDPACGSGNFLYVSLRSLLDLEAEIVSSALWEGLAREDIRVNPKQLYGMEIDPTAHKLASIVVWIGFLQWKYEHRMPLTVDPPILHDLNRANIKRMDAILSYDADGKPTEPEWVTADVIIGNPPFLGGKRQRTELGDKYLDDLFALYDGRVPHEADLVTYWFERARAHIKAGKAKRAGLLATNSIRGGANRVVLNRIKESGEIFMAWADRAWVLEEAAVRVSMVGFDAKQETERTLDGKPVNTINSDLTAKIDLTKSKKLRENANCAFMGITPAGPFDISQEIASSFLESPNISGVSNKEVVHPYWNAEDVVQARRNVWIVDFGVDTAQQDAAQFEAPFEYVKTIVLPSRLKSKQPQREKDQWWLFTRTRPEMRKAIQPLTRFIVTPAVSKHRVFTWLPPSILVDHACFVIARDDDYFFGVLHSIFHERWSLRMGTSLEDRPRYTPTSTFETFPFPFVPGQEDFTDPRVMAVSAAAKQLHDERQAWLDDNTYGDQKDRTLTNVYNALMTHRGQDGGRIKPAAAAFAPRLHELHTALDQAVCAAYGWDAAILNDEEAMLEALLMLNQARAG